MYKTSKNITNCDITENDKHKPCTYEEIRDIVLDKNTI